MTTITADIGGTKIAAARITDDGRVDGDVVSVDTPATAGALAIIRETVLCLRRVRNDTTTAVGISCAGVVDTSRGRIVGATQSLAGWAGTHVATQIGEALGLPTVAIGDGHAFALGEAAYGQAAGHTSALVLAVGTGIGGSYIERGRPMLGSHWAAGHFGHLPVAQAAGIPCDCGRVGHLEAIASGAGMVRAYHRTGGDQAVTHARELMTRLDTDAGARTAVGVAAEALGCAAGGLANAFDPEIVVIAGGVAQAGAHWRNPVQAAFQATLIPALAGMTLAFSDGGSWLALRGAAAYAQASGAQE